MDVMSQYAVVRWRISTARWKEERCGAISFMDPSQGHIGGYGFPLNGGVGALVLFDGRTDALNAIDAGVFDAHLCRHEPRSLKSLRFVADGGPKVIGSPRLFKVHGNYQDCIIACGIGVLCGAEAITVSETEPCGV
jgi:hypothetical protein